MKLKYEHDTERWLRSQAKIYAMRNNLGMAATFERCADDVKSAKDELAALRLVRSENEAGRINEEWWANMVAHRERLKAELAALKAAARLLILTTQPVLGEDGHLWITEHAVDALAALVGEEGK